MSAHRWSSFDQDRKLRLLAGLGTSVLSVASYGATYPLKLVAPVVSLSVVYLPAALLVSAYFGLALGLVTSLLSAAAFNFFHLPPGPVHDLGQSQLGWR